MITVARPVVPTMQCYRNNKITRPKKPKLGMNGVERARANVSFDEVPRKFSGATDGTFVRLRPPIGHGDCCSAQEDPAGVLSR